MKSKKQIYRGIAAMLSVSLLTASIMLPATSADAAKKIKLNKTKLTLQQGNTYQLKLSVKKGSIKWASSKKKVATVNKKGKVTAKKPGSATITAKYQGKKYKCKVTVKNKVTTPKPTTKTTILPTATQTSQPTPVQTPSIIPTPIPIPTPDSGMATPSANPLTSSTPDITETPEPNKSSTPTPTKEPIVLDELAKKIELKSELLSNHLLITVTNHNSSWVDEVTINYDYYDIEENNIDSGYKSLYSMQANETQYISIPLSDTFAALDLNASEVYPEVIEADSEMNYLDLKNEISFDVENINLENLSLPINFVNHSKYDAKISYAVLFYDEDHKVIDAYTDKLALSAKRSGTEFADLPVNLETEETSFLYTDYEILYTAHGKETPDEFGSIIRKITLTPEKTRHTLLVKVVNTDTKWLSSLNLDYQLYDANDNFIASVNQDLGSLKPNEAQYFAFDSETNLEPEQIEAIDFDMSYATIKPTAVEEGTFYNSTTNVSGSVAISEQEENAYDITISNNQSSYDVEGVYILRFYDADKQLIAASLLPYELDPESSTTLTVNGPVDTAADGTPVYAASYKLERLAAHTVQSTL